MVCELAAPVRGNDVTPCYKGGFVLQFALSILAALRGFWSRWFDVLVIVKPETVVGWHRVAAGQRSPMRFVA
jgi:hypothetical protein